MGNYIFNERFYKEKELLKKKFKDKQFGLLFWDNFNELIFEPAIKTIIAEPYPKIKNENWKILDDPKDIFDYKEGVIVSYKITHWDRIVYELRDSDGHITFTNCYKHHYRDKSYSNLNSEIGQTKTFSEYDNILNMTGLDYCLNFGRSTDYVKLQNETPEVDLNSRTSLDILLGR